MGRDLPPGIPWRGITHTHTILLQLQWFALGTGKNRQDKPGKGRPGGAHTPGPFFVKGKKNSSQLPLSLNIIAK